MADSIKITFLPETVSESIVFYNTGDPSFSEIKSFFQDITHMLTPEEAQLDDFLITIPHHKAIVKGYYETDESEEVEAEYLVADASQMGSNQTMIMITNYWEIDLNETQPEDFIRLQIIMQHGYLAIDQAFPGVTKFEITFFKGSEKKTVPEPEVYPSVARSLDKLVDKMEGNTVEVPGDPKVFETDFEYGIENGNFQGYISREFTLNDEEVTVELVHDNSVLSSLKLYKYITEAPGSNVRAIGYTYPKDNPNAENAFMIITDSPFSLGQFSAVGQCYTDFFEGKLTFPENYSGGPLYSDDYGLRLRFTGGQTSKTIPAYETYKEAVPSVERSMWKIAELFSNTDSKSNNVESKNVYDVANVDRYEFSLNYDAPVTMMILDKLQEADGKVPIANSIIDYDALCDHIKIAPFVIDSFKAKIYIVGAQMSFEYIKSSFAYVDANNNIHSLISASYGYKTGSSGMSGNFDEALLFGEIIITEDATVNCDGLLAITNSESPSQKIVQGTNMLCDIPTIPISN